MRKSSKILYVAAALTLSASINAAKPVKITPSNGSEINGESCRNYTVECSNGKNQPITSWENGKKWCVGKDAQVDCVKKQIKAAKMACKAD